jgi:hypothetical protein
MSIGPLRRASGTLVTNTGVRSGVIWFGAGAPVSV